MFARNRRRTLARTQSTESLESRELLSATANVVNGTLVVQGTNAADLITITTRSNGQTTVENYGRSIGSFSTSRIHSIDAQLNSGNDTIKFDMLRANFRSVAVNMGDGSGQEVIEFSGREIGTMKIDSEKARGMLARLYNTKLTTLECRCGNDTAEDRLSLHNDCTVDRLFARLGDGRDTLHIPNKTVVKDADVDLGKGDDYCFVSPAARVSGTISGGDGTDTISADSAARRRASFLRFERNG
jgi:hypothetical protein